MADTKLTGLAALTSVIDTDIFYVVDDPGGTPLSRKITLANLLAQTVLANGTRALSANWDVGSFKIIAQQFESDVVTGTAPIVVASTTVVPNLNADQVDGKDAIALLLVDGTQAMAANLVMGDNSVTGINNLDFTDTAGTIAGIQNQNLLDKAATETISGSWTLSSVTALTMTGNLVMGDNSVTGIDTLTFTDLLGTVAGIQNQNLVDKSAVETITGSWTLSVVASIAMTGNVVMADNSVTGIDTLTFTDVLGTIAGIQNQNLLDKSATEVITGAWTFAGATLTDDIVMGDNSITGLNILTFTDVNGTIAGIQNQNLTDKAAAETISGDWTHTGILGIAEENRDTTPTADHSANGPTTSDLNAGYTAIALDLVYLGSAGKWLEADASAVATAGGMLAMTLEAGTDTNPLKVALPGSYVRDDTWAWTPGVTLYASETLGSITTTAPTTADAVVRVIGFALTADIIYFQPSSDHITVTG